MARNRVAVRFTIDRASGRPFAEQVRDQFINHLHFGSLAAGQRLPAVRALARDGGINLKTAFKIYRFLARAGLVEIRPQAGIFVRPVRGKAEQAYRRSVDAFLTRVSAEARRLNLTPRRLIHLLALRLPAGAGPQPPAVTCAVLECNGEQPRLFAAEIERKLGVRAVPLALFSPTPPAGAAAVLRDADFLLTTDFHWEEGLRVAQRYRKKILRLRLDPGFVKLIAASARRGAFTMVLADTSIQPSFRRAMAAYLRPEELDRIRLVHCSDRKAIAEATARGGRVYLSPLCAGQTRRLLPAGVTEVRHDDMVSAESLRELRDSLLFYPLEHRKAKAAHS
jgi:DNA-binding transcriptional regulator YhcF (GntR family)